MAARPIWRWPAIFASASIPPRCSCRRHGWPALLQERHRTYVTRLGVDNAKKLFLTRKSQRARDAADRLPHRHVSVEFWTRKSTSLPPFLAGNAPVAMRGMKRAINEFARASSMKPPPRLRHRESMRGAEIKEASRRPPKSGRRNSRSIAGPGHKIAKTTHQE